MPLKNKYYLKYFFGLSLLFVFLLAAISYYVYDNRYNLFITEKTAIEQTNLKNYKQAIESEFDEIAVDIELLSGLECINDYLNKPNNIDLKRLTGSFLLFSNSIKKYDQIRYIESSGQEICRVNFKNDQAIAVPQEQLQNKQHRYYFKASMDLDQDCIYISKFDLNIENKIIEEPIKPMIRFGIPVFDDNKEKKGALILNYLGDNLLKKLDQFKKDSITNIILLNKDSYYLKSNVESVLWGFMYEDKLPLNFKKEFPQIWEEMRSKDRGSCMMHNVFVSFEKINFNAFNAFTNETQTPDNFWIIATVLPKNELQNLKASILKPIILISLSVLLVLIILSHIIARIQYKRFQTEKRLISEKEIAVRANADKDRFVSIVAHDLKTPFSAVLGFSNLLKDNFDTYSDEQKKMQIEHINTSSKNIYQLFDNLLTWGRTKTGRIVAEPNQYTIRENLLKTINLINITAKGKSIEIIEHIDDSFSVFADMNLVNTVVRNLLSNAVKYTPEEGVVEINSQVQGDYVVVSIKDNGLGISDELKKDLFRIDKTIYSKGTNNEVGTGLGLLVCKEFVEMNHGEIWLESEVNKGSTFYFSIPKKDLRK